MDNKRSIMIVAGEASGDRHAAKLVRALREKLPDFEVFGAAGPDMRESGVEAIVEADRLSVVGLTEIGRALPMFLSAMRKLKSAAIARRPGLVVLVDFPDFNLKLARWAKRRGHKVVYYISPQLWAWRSRRIEVIRRYVDLVISILPFEKEWFAQRGVSHVEYVGSPLAREVHSEVSKTEFCCANELDPGRPIVSLLPGSREKEIERILPIMLRSTATVTESVHEAQFVVALASESDMLFAKNLADRTVRNARFVAGSSYDALAASDAAVITSGTATLEAGIIGTPMVVVYKTSALNYRLLEPMIDVPHYGLINLIAGDRVATELIQDDLTAEKLAAEVLRLMKPAENAAIRERLRIAVEKLGRGGASKRAAEAIIALISK